MLRSSQQKRDWKVNIRLTAGDVLLTPCAQITIMALIQIKHTGVISPVTRHRRIAVKLVKSPSD